VKPTLKVIILAIAGFLFGLSLPAAHGGQAEKVEPQKPGTVTVNIELLTFPEEITVKAETTVRWVNLDPVDHDVTSGTSITGRKARGKKKVKFHDGKFKSDLFGKDQTFEVTFMEKGVHQYFCNIHPFMVGKVIVE
jgi:plastocyanin